MNHTISVTGSGTAAAPPSVALVDLGVEVMARSVAEARSTAAVHMEAVVAAVRAEGVAEGNVRTTAYTIHPDYDHRQGHRLLRGYRVANMVQVQIDNIELVGSVIDAASEAGSEYVVVQGLQFVHSEPSALETEARTRAWEDASDRAAQLARLAGVELGAVKGISEQHGHGGPVMRAVAFEAADAPPIESGELAVAVTVQVEFEIA